MLYVLKMLKRNYLILVIVAISLFSQAVFAQSTSEKKKSRKAPAGEPIKLESTFVGDKEQPAISYFIPWKGTGTPDKLNWTIESKHDDTLDVVDRDVMRRSMNIYDEMGVEGK